jgi:hypothetical protein
MMTPERSGAGTNFAERAGEGAGAEEPSARSAAEADLGGLASGQRGVVAAENQSVGAADEVDDRTRRQRERAGAGRGLRSHGP